MEKQTILSITTWKRSFIFNYDNEVLHKKGINGVFYPIKRAYVSP